ncbi:MAG TPA: hypothetical protein VGA78_13970 [Gemmatimonadales bacterium]
MSRSRLSGAQQAQLMYLEGLRPKFERIHRLIEEIANFQGGESTIKTLIRLLDEQRHGASTLLLNSLADNLGMMSTVARRGGGHQMRVRALREGFSGLKTNFEGAFRQASTPREAPKDEDEERS